MKRKIFIFFALFAGIALMASLAITSDRVGEVAALKGKADIIRLEKTQPASLKDSILLMDTVATRAASRMKILFLDDSLLTLGEKSRMSIKQYLLGDDKKRGQSVFNLMDGRVRAIVGKNKFEIQTPTAVAAARGTVMIVWIKNSKPTTCTAVLQGSADTSNIDPSVQGTKTIPSNNMSCVPEGEPPTDPEPIPPDLLTDLLGSTSLDDTYDGLESPQEEPSGEQGGPEFPALPPIEQEPPAPQSNYYYY